MAEPAPRASRRHLVLGALAGVVAGGAWGAAIQALARPSSPTISLVGSENSLIALIDTTDVRVLLMLGPADDGLIAEIPTLLTLARQRIDIVIGASSTLSGLPPGFGSRWKVLHTFSIPGDGASPPNTETASSVTDDLRLDLPHQTVLAIRRSTRLGWKAGADEQHGWKVSVGFGTVRALFVPDMLSAEMLTERGADVLVLPTGDLARLVRICAPSSIAMNAENGMEVPAGSTLVRVFPSDVARFTVEDGQVGMPPWATSEP